MAVVLVQDHRISGRRQDEKNTGTKSREQRYEAFLAWLQRNGAQFDGVEWPCTTDSGTRGAVARRDIATGEHMVIIPRQLMMSEVHAKNDPELGHVHRANLSVFKNDNGLTLYVMQEMLKGDQSFYWPYLNILPKPRNLRHWDDKNLEELQDPRLVRRNGARKRHLQALYRHTMGILDSSYPGLFPTEQYTFELFDFAWGTIQARAFGRRLSCTALVPLADCLNHGNVQTKYDFDVEENGVFRLFPSGNNRYLKGSEVLNSYGRRTNDTLLLEYGFAMPYNEWDEVELSCTLSEREPSADRRREVLSASGQFSSRVFRLRRDCWAEELLYFNRCACLTESELDCLEAQRPQNLQPPSATTAATTSTPVGDSSSTNPNDAAYCARAGNQVKKDPEKNVKMDGVCSNVVEGSTRRDRTEIDASVENSGAFPFRALSAENELAALTEVVLKLHDAIRAFPTTIGCDEGLLHEIEKDERSSPELLSALVYRITAKRVLERQLDMAERAIGLVKDIAFEVDSAQDTSSDTSASSTSTSNTSAATTGSSGSEESDNCGGEILFCGPHFHMCNIQTEDDDGVALSPTFAAYLIALKSELLLPICPPVAPPGQKPRRQR